MGNCDCCTRLYSRESSRAGINCCSPIVPLEKKDPDKSPHDRPFFLVRRLTLLLLLMLLQFPSVTDCCCCTGSASRASCLCPVLIAYALAFCSRWHNERLCRADDFLGKERETNKKKNHSALFVVVVRCDRICLDETRCCLVVWYSHMPPRIFSYQIPISGVQMRGGIL